MKKTRILDRIVPGYTEKFLSGQFSLEEMPLLKAIGNNFSSMVNPSDLKNIHLVACQHMLAPQLEMFRLFVKLGIPASQITILPKIYSTNIEIISELRQLGCIVIETALEFNPKESFDSFHQKQCANVVNLVAGNVSKTSKIIILDDGGMLIREFVKKHKQFHCLVKSIQGVEQTASGKHILLENELPFIVTSVASSIEKIQIETDYIVRHSMTRILEYFTEQGIGHKANILVLGKGPIGNATIEAFKKAKYNCVGYDLIDGKLSYQINEFDVIVGATGKNSISIEMLSLLKKGSHLISIASSDREFPGMHIRSNSLSGSEVHDTFIYKENNIHLANGGFPITFKGKRIECYPLEMDITKMKLSESVMLHAIKQTKIETSVNILYFDKVLKRVTPLFFYSWCLLLFGLSVLRIFMFNLDKPPIWFILSIYVVLFYGCIPFLWVIKYFKRLELFILERSQK